MINRIGSGLASANQILKGRFGLGGNQSLVTEISERIIQALSAKEDFVPCSSTEAIALAASMSGNATEPKTVNSSLQELIRNWLQIKKLAYDSLSLADSIAEKYLLPLTEEFNALKEKGEDKTSFAQRLHQLCNNIGGDSKRVFAIIENAFPN